MPPKGKRKSSDNEEGTAKTKKARTLRRASTGEKVDVPPGWACAGAQK